MTKNLILIGALLTIFFSCQKVVREELDDANVPELPHHVKLSWKTSPETSQAVSWRTTDKVTNGVVEYVKATASPFFEDDVKTITAKTDTLTSDDGTWAYHQANITGLQPATTYSYRVGDGTNWSEWTEFSTASDKKEPFTFLYHGDVQRFIYSKGSRTIREAYIQNPDAKFMVFGGDLVHRGKQNIENWGEFFPAGGFVFQKLPTIATPGNHEHYNPKAGMDLVDLWFLNFEFPENGPAGHEEETFYFDYQNMRIISLNLCRYNNEEDRKAIYEWTEARLKEFTGDWVVMTHHYGMEALARNRKPGIRFPDLKELYEKYEVDLVLAGHEHLYARGRMDAPLPVHVISVSGPFQNAIRFADWIERAGTNLQLYQEIHVSSDTLHYITKTVLGDVYDEFKIGKDVNGKKTFIESENLPPESLIPTLNFEDRYDKELVDSYEDDKKRYLEKNTLE
ncbi:MAG: metallophosphoesterase [Thalassobius sp.]|nr:metallophosphoesterase [Thalassovita sp.]